MSKPIGCAGNRLKKIFGPITLDRQALAESRFFKKNWARKHLHQRRYGQFLEMFKRARRGMGR